MADATKSKKKVLTWPERATAMGLTMAGKDPTKEEKQKIVDAERRDRFLRLAPKRVNGAAAALGRVENLANKGGYDFTADEAEKIIEHLNESVLAVAHAFKRAIEGKGSTESPGFTL